jgi:hypothetical protein
MDLAVSLFIGFVALIAVGSAAFIGLSFYVGWTGYTHIKQDED